VAAISGSGGDGADAAASEAAMQAVLSGGVARIVFRGAVAAVPGDLQFQARFLAALEPFRFPGLPPAAPGTTAVCALCLLQNLATDHCEHD